MEPSSVVNGTRFALLAAVVVLTGCQTTQTRILSQSAVIGRNEPNTAIAAQSGDLEVLNVDNSKRFGNEYVQGMLKNTGDKDYQYVEVTINCYDSSGKLIEPVIGTRTGLHPGRSWRFKLRMTRPAEVDHYQVASIVAW
jgi:hypothetical protein